VSNHVVLVLGNENGGPHHMQGRHTRDPRDWFKESSEFGFEYSSNTQMRLHLFVLPLYLCLA